MRFIIYLLYIFIFWGFVACRSSVSHQTHSHKTTTATTNRKQDQQIALLVAQARSYIGTAYQYGGNGQSGFDCSGLVCKIAQYAGVPMPRISNEQAAHGLPVSLSEIQIGDLLFFGTNGAKQINHVGMVTDVQGPERITFIHASTSKGVIEDLMSKEYWKKTFIKAKRPFVF
jgi:probable lipoprotein NlpC